MKSHSLTSILILAVCMLGLSSATLFAQTFPGTPDTPIDEPSDLHVGTVTNNTAPVNLIEGAVLFYNPAEQGPSLDINASLTDENGKTFSSYIWYNMTYDGTTETENEIPGETGATLHREELEPGYHKFRVYGISGEADCQSDDYEDIILFVLSELSVKPIHNLNGGSLTYCENDVPAPEDAIELSITSLTTDYSANTNGYTNPLAEDFELKYAWFAVLDGNTANPVSLGNTETVSMTLAPSGTYSFYVEVEYAIKAKGDRTYVTYRGDLNDIDTGDAIEVIVTPAPGNPTISIDDVID